MVLTILNATMSDEVAPSKRAVRTWTDIAANAETAGAPGGKFALVRFLPDDLKGSAWVAGNGELAWSPENAVEVIRHCRASQVAIREGEIYEVLPETHWGSFASAWRLDRRPSEEWLDFVVRCADHALAEIARARQGPWRVKALFAITAEAPDSTGDSRRNGNRA